MCRDAAGRCGEQQEHTYAGVPARARQAVKMCLLERAQATRNPRDMQATSKDRQGMASFSRAADAVVDMACGVQSLRPDLRSADPRACKVAVPLLQESPTNTRNHTTPAPGTWTSLVNTHPRVPIGGGGNSTPQGTKLTQPHTHNKAAAHGNWSAPGSPSAHRLAVTAGGADPACMPDCEYHKTRCDDANPRPKEEGDKKPQL